MEQNRKTGESKEAMKKERDGEKNERKREVQKEQKK